MSLLTLHLRSLPTLIACVVTTAGLGFAQLPALTLTSFSEESVLTQDQLTSPDAPSLPDDLVSTVQSGLAELHQVLVYDSTQSTLVVKLWLLPVGTPVPTPNGVTGNLVSSYTVNVKGITATETGAVLNGMITNAEGVGGIAQGGLMTASLGFVLQSPDAVTGAAPAVFSTVDVSIAGVGSLAATSGRGSLKVTGDKGAKLPLAVAGPKGQQFYTPSFSLSALQSVDPNGGTLTYKWALVPAAGQSVALQGATSAAPLVTIFDNGAAFGVYTFQLTVTNSAGLSSIDTVTVDYEQP